MQGFEGVRRAVNFAVQLAGAGHAVVSAGVSGGAGVGQCVAGSAWSYGIAGPARQPGLMMLAAAMAHAGAGYQHNETAGASARKTQPRLAVLYCHGRR